MIPLLVTVVIAVIVSFYCSLTESMLLSVPATHVQKMLESGTRSGQLLYRIKTNIDQPISAVLTLNTVANTAGSSVAGAFAAVALGAGNMPLFALAFTVLILLAGEIIPKTVGVTYAIPLSGILIYPLAFFAKLLRPVTWLSGFVTRLFTRKTGAPQATEDDITAMASLSLQSGTIQDYEESILKNVLALDDKKVSDVMTPRTVVFSLPSGMRLAEALSQPQIWQFSRIPVYEADNEDIVGLISRRDIAMAMSQGKEEITLAELMRPVHFVFESLTLDKVLSEFLEQRQHLSVVLDEYGGLAGVISLEDVLEEMLGREIVDESDSTTDMRELARQGRTRAMDGQRAAKTGTGLDLADD